MSIKNYSVYSTDAGLLNIDDILNQEFTKKTNKAVLTDYNTLMGVPEFFDKSQRSGVMPIVGVTITIGDENTRDGDVTLYAMNSKGFDNLKKIVSTIKEDSFKKSYTSIDSIFNNSEHLSILVGGHNTILYNKLKIDDNAGASKFIYQLKKAFKDNVYLEIQVNYQDNEEQINNNVLKIASEMSLNVFATNNQRIKSEAHYPLLIEKIKTKRGINNKSNNDVYQEVLPSDAVRTSEQMGRSFKPYLGKINNISSLFNKVKPYNIFVDIPEIPNFPNINNEDYFMNVLSEKYKKFIKTIPEDKVHIYSERLKEEIAIIKELNFEKYFIIFEQIEKNKVDNQRFNLRGSSVSFLTTHILGLSDIDPVEHELLPERFLNRNRLVRHELPDIDLESNDTDSVMRFLYQIFGEKNIAYLSNSESPKSKSQIELAERALRQDIVNNPVDAHGKERVFPENDFLLLKKVVSCIYNSDKITLDDAFQGYVTKRIAAQVLGLKGDFNSQEFKKEYFKISNLTNLCNNNPNIKKIVGYIKTIDNVILTHGVSTASVVVSNSNIESFFSTQFVKDNKNYQNKHIKIAIEASKKYVEKLGLIKLDILSSKYLDKLQTAYNITGMPWDNETHSQKYSDKSVYDMISKGYTSTLNQIKSVKQQDLAARIKISNFEELYSFLALIRPGVSSESVDKYIENKNNKDKIHYEHPIMKIILEKTHGIIIFEEQIMLIAQKIGNFSKEESDDFRSLMKKVGTSNKQDSNFLKLEQMKKDLVSRAIEFNKLTPKSATNIIEQLEEMQGYTFSKAHSLSYAGLLYRQAYFDANYPAEYFESHIIKEGDNKIRKFEMKEYSHKLVLMDRCFLNVDINRSLDSFKTRRKNGIVYIDPSISHIVKDESLSNIILEERAFSKFDNIYDFVERTVFKATGLNQFSGEWLESESKMVKPTNVYRNTVVKLINSGAFDNISPMELINKGVEVNRATLVNSLDSAISLATNPYSHEDFEYKIPEKIPSIKDVISNEDFVYNGFSPTLIRQMLDKKNNPTVINSKVPVQKAPYQYKNK